MRLSIAGLDDYITCCIESKLHTYGVTYSLVACNNDVIARFISTNCKSFTSKTSNKCRQCIGSGWQILNSLINIVLGRSTPRVEEFQAVNSITTIDRICPITLVFNSSVIA